MSKHLGVGCLVVTVLLGNLALARLVDGEVPEGIIQHKVSLLLHCQEEGLDEIPLLLALHCVRLPVRIRSHPIAYLITSQSHIPSSLLSSAAAATILLTM